MNARTNRLRIEAVLEVLPMQFRAGARVLDVGAGGGAYSKKLEERGWKLELFSLDLEKTCVEAYRLNHPGAKGTVGDAVLCPFAAFSFDLILAIDIIEHLPDDTAFLAGMKRLLKPNGVLVICTQNSASIENAIGTCLSLIRGKKWVGWDPTHLRFYTSQNLARMLRAQELEVFGVNGTYYFPFHLPARVLSKPFEMMGLDRLAQRLYDVLVLPFYALNYPFEKLSKIFPFQHFGWGVIVQARKPRGNFESSRD